MRDHTSLLAWQCSRNVTLTAFRISAAHWTPTAAPALEQLRRAALSVQLNIAEGHALGSRAAFRRHLRIAYGSAVETSDLVRLLTELELAPPDFLDRLREQNRRSQQLVLALLHKLSAP